MGLPSALNAWLETPDGSHHPLLGNCTIGRSSASTIVISNVKASRQHATIHIQDGEEFWLIDLGSSNGTMLNDRRVVRPVKLEDEDRIVIAETPFLFRHEAPDKDEHVTLAATTVVNVRTEKRWLLLADLEGFTPLSQRLPPDELATLVGLWVRSGREIVESNGGTLNKYLGDGYMACWPERPGAALEVAAAVTAFHAQWEKAEPKFRIVVHYGTVAIGGAAAASFGEESLMGPEINFTFRVEKIAGAAGVSFCFTASAKEQLGTALALELVPGKHEMKGFPDSYELFRL